MLFFYNIISLALSQTPSTNLVLNSDFANGISGWTYVGADVTRQNAKLSKDGYITQNINTAVGASYKVSLNVRGSRSSSVVVSCGETNQTFHSKKSWQKFSLECKATSETTKIQIQNVNGRGKWWDQTIFVGHVQVVFIAPAVAPMQTMSNQVNATDNQDTTSNLIEPAADSQVNNTVDAGQPLTETNSTQSGEATADNSAEPLPIEDSLLFPNGSTTLPVVKPAENITSEDINLPDENTLTETAQTLDAPSDDTVQSSDLQSSNDTTQSTDLLEPSNDTDQSSNVPSEEMIQAIELLNAAILRDTSPVVNGNFEQPKQPCSLNNCSSSTMAENDLYGWQSTDATKVTWQTVCTETDANMNCLSRNGFIQLQHPTVFSQDLSLTVNASYNLRFAGRTQVGGSCHIGVTGYLSYPIPMTSEWKNYTVPLTAFNDIVRISFETVQGQVELDNVEIIAN